MICFMFFDQVFGLCARGGETQGPNGGERKGSGPADQEARGERTIPIDCTGHLHESDSFRSPRDLCSFVLNCPAGAEWS